MARSGDGITKRSNTWWLDARIDGTRYQIRLGKGISRTDAQKLAQAKRGEILKGEAGIGAKKRKDLPFAEAQKLFLEWAETNKRPRTAEFYRQCLGKLSATFATKRLSEIHPFHLEAYKSKRVKDGSSVRCNRELATLKALYNRMASLGHYDGENPARGGQKGIQFLEESKGQLRFFDRGEEERLLAACSEPLRTIVLAGIYTGLRVSSELLSLRWGSVDFHQNQITVLAAYAKNKRTRSVPMNSVLRKALLEHKRAAPSTGPEDHVFLAWKGPRKGKPLRSVRTALETAAGKVKIAGVTPHVLRHTFASRLCMAGVDLRTVQELGGWSTLAMVQRYSHLSPEHKVEAVERMLRTGVAAKEELRAVVE